MTVAIGASDIDVTRHGLENGLRVRHIMTEGLEVVPQSMTASAARSRADDLGFDYLPVQDEAGLIVGLFARRRVTGDGSVGEEMTPLNGRLLVSADQSLGSFLPTLRAQDCRLVVDGHEIRGIVTRSDLLKMPVRLFTFSLLAHLEMRMSDMIRGRFGDDDQAWLDLLSDERRLDLTDRHGRLSAGRLDISPLEYAYLSDKATVIKKSGVPASISKSQFDRDFRAIEELRNQVMHHGAFVEDEIRDPAGLDRFLDNLTRCEQWFQRMAEH